MGINDKTGRGLKRYGRKPQVCVCVLYIHACVYSCMCVYIDIDVCIYVCGCVYIYMCIYVCILMCMSPYPLSPWHSRWHRMSAGLMANEPALQVAECLWTVDSL